MDVLCWRHPPSCHQLGLRVLVTFEPGERLQQGIYGLGNLLECTGYHEYSRHTTTHSRWLLDTTYHIEVREQHCNPLVDG
jgi:hypothetical protein